MQNLPVFVVPQAHVQLSAAGVVGFGLPHSGQNLPVAVAPQLQAQLAAGAGLGAPHPAQNFPVLPDCPQVHAQSAEVAGAV